MTIHYKLTESERKAMAEAIATWLGTTAVFSGSLDNAYTIGFFTLDNDGDLIFSDRANAGVIDSLLSYLATQGFVKADEAQATESPMESREADSEPFSLAVSLPKSMISDRVFQNLEAILLAKGNLIKKALGVEDLPVVIDENRVCFNWFNRQISPEELKAYELFVCKLCEMAEKQKRINATEKPVANEKYAFRCFLLRLGFIGDEFKAQRKILLSRLDGSSAFRKEVKGGENE